MPRHKRGLGASLAAVGLAVLCLVGCARKPPKKPSARPSVSKAAATWETPTDQQCEQFAALLEQSVASGDLAAFNDAIDWDAILESATGGIEGVEEARRGFIAGAQRALSTSGSLGAQLIQQVAGGATYRFLRTHMEGDEKRVLFRFLSPETGVNYHDLVVMRQPDGKLRAVDVYVFLAAEKFSKTLRRTFIPLAAEASKNILVKLTGAENDYVKNIVDIQQMTEAVRGGQYHRALDIYAKLPPLLQKDKNILLIRLQAAMKAGEQEYVAALNAFRTYHPKDPCLDFVLIDKYVYGQQYDQALGCVERLDAAVGGDPYLDVMRANISIAQKEFGAARQLARKAIEADGTLIDGYWSLVSVSLAERDFDETSRLLNTIGQKFEVKPFDLENTPEYAEYTKSPQYQEWLKTRSPAPK